VSQLKGETVNRQILKLLLAATPNHWEIPVDITVVADEIARYAEEHPECREFWGFTAARARHPEEPNAANPQLLGELRECMESGCIILVDGKFHVTSLGWMFSDRTDWQGAYSEVAQEIAKKIPVLKP
jgi:hypothetical protein